MTIKSKIITASLAMSCLWFVWSVKTYAEPMLGGPYAPTGIRIPAEIELLADTPYYSSAEHPYPEGVFAPQSVKVLKTQASWSTGGVTWEIETMFGPRWIRPKPWEIDIAPPKKIMLMEETPLYASQNENEGPVASLSSQEVEVTAAEEKWFYTNDRTSKAWIQVHTTWMGDLWAHIPVERIGTVQEVQVKTYYPTLWPDQDLSSAMGFTPFHSGPNYFKGEFTVMGEFTTIYDRAYFIQTDQGTTWMRERGVPILKADETLEITTETPLIADIWDGAFKEIELLKGERVTVFEKVEEPLRSYWREIFPVWYGSTWYHVQTSKGTGWINKNYAYPENSVSVNWKVKLSGNYELQRYPGIPYRNSTLLLKNETVLVSEFWDDSYGNKWIKLNVDGKQGWIPLHYMDDERIWDEDKETALQIKTRPEVGIGILSKEDGSLRLYDERKIGFEENGAQYLEATLLGEQFRFQSEKLSYADAVKFSHGDYAFMLEAGFRNAIIYWRGNVVDSVMLQEHPRRKDEGWYLNVNDLQTLFGFTGEFRDPYMNMLFVMDYNVELGKLPTIGRNGRLELEGFLYQSIRNQRLSIQLSLEEQGDHGGNEFVTNSVAVTSKRDPKPDELYSLFEITASRSLSPGTHQVDLVLRVGKRIFWKQTISVTSE